MQQGNGTGTAASAELLAENVNRGNVILTLTNDVPVGIGVGGADAVADEGSPLFSAGDSITLTGVAATGQINIIGNTAVVAYQTGPVISRPAGAAILSDLADVGVLAYTAGKILVADGDSIEEVTMSQGATINSSGVVTIGRAFGNNVDSKVAAGSVQGDSTALGGRSLNIVTGADGTKGVQLEAATSGIVIPVFNAGSAILKVYPIDGGNDEINGAGANVPISMAANSSAIFVGTAGTTWHTFPTVPS